MRLREFIGAFEKRYPPDWAMPDDKVGLLCGDLNRAVEKIILALDATESVIREAVDGGYDLLITHHSPAKRSFNTVLANDRITGKVYYAVQHDLAIYTAHTNLDFAPDGVSVVLAEILGVKFEKYLRAKCNESLYKLAVFVPKEHFEKFRKSFLDIGVGHIGNYSHCSFSGEGEGSFLPMDGAKPFIGEVGKLETVEELRFETIVPKHLLAEALEAIRTLHPYEEPAFDIYPLENDAIKGGFGVVGAFNATTKLFDIIELCRRKLPTESVRYIGIPERYVRKAAVVGGSGDHVLDDIISEKVDILITGDISHSSALALNDAQMAVVLPGHFATEWIILPHVRDVITEILESYSVKGDVTIAEAENSLFKA